MIPAIPILGTHLEKIIIQKAICAPMFTAAYNSQDMFSGGRGHGYTYVWFMLMFGRNEQNSVKQLSFN